MPSWKKVIVSGSDAVLNALTVTNGITGSLHGTASWAQNAITASYVLNAVSASYALNADLLDGRDSSVFATTGSNIFVGNQTVTGSLFTTGSNTLIGTTSLTGSLNISGSETIRGYIQFEPVTTNINAAISASYIYVSGSTNDLYFSQNSKGYSNTTRLRWLEGNLYTGLLHGGLITTQSSTVYQISSGSGIIVDLNASLSDDPYPVIQFLQWGNLSASIAPFTASYQQAFVGIDSTNNIFAQGTPFSNGQFSDIINVGNVLFQNQSTINGVKTQPSVAYGFEQQQNTFNRAFGPLKLSGYTLAPSGSSTGSLIVASGTAYAPGSNYSIDPNDPSYTIDPGTNVSKIFRYHQSGSTWVYNTNGGPGFATIDPTKYSNNGVLTNVGGGNWTIQRCFYFPNSVTKAIVVYYGNARYGTEAEARANIDFESFVEAPNTSANAIYLGAIIINGTGVFTSPGDFTIYPGGLFRQVGGSGGGGSIVTQTLAGLSDVNISGPIDGQALVYNHTAAKWENKSSISASITGNAATATSASFATTASHAAFAVSSSQATSASYATFAQTASYATNITISGSIANVDYIDFDLTASFASAIGRLGYDSGEGTLQFGLAGGNVTMNIGSDLFQYVYNNTTSSLSKGQVVYISGSQGNRIAVKLASAVAEQGSANTLGFVAETISAGGEGWVQTEGNLRQLNTVGLIGGELLYLGTTPGTYTQTPPVAPDHGVRLGYAERIDNTVGSIYIKIDNGYELGELHNVIDSSTSSSYGDLFIKSGSVWINSRQLTGSYGLTGSLQATSFTGSLLGTASYASQALSSSFATTASYVLNAVSASFATTASQAQNANTASYADQFRIGQSQMQYATVASSISGSNLVYNQSTGSYTSAFFKYTVASGSNARSGEIMSVWNGTTVSFTDNSTTDIGTTTAVISSIVLSGANIQLNMQTSTAGWAIKSVGTFM